MAATLNHSTSGSFPGSSLFLRQKQRGKYCWLWQSVGNQAHTNVQYFIWMSTCTQLNSIFNLTLVKTTGEKWEKLLCSISNRAFGSWNKIYFLLLVSKRNLSHCLTVCFVVCIWVTLETQISKFNKTPCREKRWKKYISVHLFSVNMVIETGSMTLTRDSTRTRNVSRKVTQLPYQ